MFKKLVIDTIVWNFDTKTSLEYIARIGKETISERYYFKIKKQVTSDQEVNSWLNHYMRVGFVLIHKMEIEELIRIKKPLLDIYYLETSKPYLILDPEGSRGAEGRAVMINNPAYNVDRVIRLATQIDSLNKSLDDLYAANPMVQAIKQKMNESNNPNVHYTN